MDKNLNEINSLILKLSKMCPRAADYLQDKNKPILASRYVELARILSDFTRRNQDDPLSNEKIQGP